MGLCGEVRRACAEIAESARFVSIDMTKLGVTNLYLMPTLTFAPPEKEVDAFRDVVFPRLRALNLR